MDALKTHGHLPEAAINDRKNLDIKTRAHLRFGLTGAVGMSDPRSGYV
jgi:hypothetical protein